MGKHIRFDWPAHRGADSMNAPIPHIQAVEPRKIARYRLEAPVFFFWMPQNGPARSNVGVTRDMNVAGVFLNADETPQVGETVHIDILLPSPVPGGPEIHLTGEGMVTRTELLSGRIPSNCSCGFAVSLRFYPELEFDSVSEVRASYDGVKHAFGKRVTKPCMNVRAPLLH